MDKMVRAQTWYEQQWNVVFEFCRNEWVQTDLFTMNEKKRNQIPKNIFNSKKMYLKYNWNTLKHLIISIFRFHLIEHSNQSKNLLVYSKFQIILFVFESLHFSVNRNVHQLASKSEWRWLFWVGERYK